jgi:RNA-directed DNA polymerase
VIDLDIRKFFDSVDHDLMVKAVQANTDQAWVVLYVKRWLTAPLQLPDGTLVTRDRGTPQGSAVSPVLANLFMHYAFDRWLEREFPTVEFERYADDAVVHCVTERQAREVLAALSARMVEVGLQLHPDKTKIVYCRDDNRRRVYPVTSFVFLSYEFRARTSRNKRGRLFDGFAPAVSPRVLKEKGRQLREMRIHRWTGASLDDLAAMINPVVAGWMDYYGRFRPWELYPLLERVNTYLARWARKKYKRLRAFGRLAAWWHGVVDRAPELFAHWRWIRTFCLGR